MVAAVSLGEVIRFASDMNKLGQEANISEARFAALTSTMGGYEEVMQAMRRATLGSVDDMALQQNSMLLIQSAGIETTAELERMSGMIMRLKKPSEDATTAFNNFGLMLANNSILRLDSFGLSASRVRERIIELRESGEAADRSEAFRMAVMEEGEKAMRRFGAAADDASTSITRMETRFENFKQNFGQRFNTGVEGGAGIIELMLGVHPSQQAEIERRVDDTATALMEDVPVVFAQALAAFGGDKDFMSEYVQQVILKAKSNPDVLNDIHGLAATIAREMSMAGDMGMDDMNAVGGIDGLTGITQAILLWQQAREAGRETANDVADADERQAAALENSARYANDVAQLQERAYIGARRFAEEQRQMDADRLFNLGQMDELVRQGIDMRGINGQAEFMTDGQAERVEALARQAEDLLETMQEMDKANEDAFSDDEMERVEQQTEYLQGLADTAREAAEAYRDMTLAQAMGREDGGMLGEMSDVIKADLEKMNATTEMIERIQRAFDLESGRETETGAVWEDRISDVIAGVAMNISEDQAVFMATRFADMMKEAQLRNIDVNDPEFAAAVEDQFATINFNPDFSGLLDEFDPAVTAAEDIKTATEGTIESATAMSDQSKAFSDNISLSADNMDRISVTSDTMVKNMEAVTSKKHVIQIQPEFVNVPTLIQMLLPALFQAVQNAGGVVPGTNQNASTSGAENRRR